jgi:hypothetical protein
MAARIMMDDDDDDDDGAGRSCGSWVKSNERSVGETIIFIR